MEFDVIVIGGGPAGCSSALHSGKLGLKTLLLEEHPIIGEPVHCGECLSELAAKRLNLNLPEEVVSLNVKGVKIIFPNGKSHFLKEKGFVLEKNKFEQWLAKEAEKNNARIEVNSKVVNVKKEGKTWKIKCSDNREFKAKILIDATGVSSFLSKKLNLNERFESVIGIQYEMKGIANNGFLDFYLWPSLAPEGYLWMIPKSNGRANVGLVTKEKSKASIFLNEFVRKMNWNKKEITKTFGGLIPSSGALKNTVADGIILVGDAAGFTSPLFEGGTSLGLTSGKFAAQIAKKAIEKKDYSKNTLREYERLWKKEFPDYNKLIKGKRALYNFSEEELNFIASFLPENVTNVSLTERMKRFFSLITRKPGMLRKGIVEAAIAFGYSRAKHYGW
jgi:digeranylgeranylglycerophospholipid reductase